MTEILESLSELITKSGWLAPLLALVAGILTSITPCALSSIPLLARIRLVIGLQIIIVPKLPVMLGI